MPEWMEFDVVVVDPTAHAVLCLITPTLGLISSSRCTHTERHGDWRPCRDVAGDLDTRAQATDASGLGEGPPFAIGFCLAIALVLLQADDVRTASNRSETLEACWCWCWCCEASHLDLPPTFDDHCGAVIS